MSVLLTGGAGYIGSHTAVELLEAGYDIVVIDNCSNSSMEAVSRIKQITGKDFPAYQIDVADAAALESVFQKENIDAVIHFSGYKAVGESVAQPLMYYRNNLDSTFALIETMEKFGVKKLVFSSSATVYGVPEKLPLTEGMKTSATNPYGQTKLMIEQILSDLQRSDSSWSISLLRYFNPVGAHQSGLIGEAPNGIPNNLMPYVSQVASGRLEKLHVYGNDYPTRDGTGARDYIHVVDLAQGHIAALKYISDKTGLFIHNLGTGCANTVLEMIAAFEKASGVKIPYVIDPRRPGDVAECYADPAKAEKELGWKAQKTLEDMCADTWNWQKNNPNGYDK